MSLPGWLRVAVMTTVAGLAFGVWGARAPANGGARVLHPAQFSDALPTHGALRGLLVAEREAAAAAGRVAYVQIWAEWCGPCRALRSALGDPRMVDAFAGTWIVRVEQDVWMDELIDVLPANEKTISVPSFYEIRADGSLGRRLTGGAWGPNTPDAMAPPLKAFFRASASFATEP